MRALATALLLGAFSCWGADPPRSFIVVVSGIGGEPGYTQRFRQWSEIMVVAAKTRLNVPREQIVYLSEDPESTDPRANGPSLKSELGATLSRLAADSQPGDLAFILLIGHGNAHRNGASFNLPGPDISATELDEMLAPFAQRRLVVVNTTPSSAPFIKELSGPDRVIITATASASERYHTLFPGHFVAAFATDGADADKDGRVSILEAFEYSRREVQRSYVDDRRLQTEHALLDDNGDGVGSMQLRAGEGDGSLARSVYLDNPFATHGAASETLLRLLAERVELLEGIEVLKAGKSELDPAVYEDRLEQLLVELALTSRAIRAAQKSP